MKNEKIKQMVGIALMMAMVVVLQFISSILPRIGAVSISLVLIPIVMGAAVYGYKGGAILGTTFGIIATINCITGADAGGAVVLQANPVLCVIVVLGKGILAGLVSAFVYQKFRNRSPYLAMLLAAIACPVVNTGVFILCMGLFFMDVLTAWAQGGSVVGFVLSVLVLTNFVPELAINVAFSPAGQRIVQQIEHK